MTKRSSLLLFCVYLLLAAAAVVFLVSKWNRSPYVTRSSPLDATIAFPGTTSTSPLPSTSTPSTATVQASSTALQSPAQVGEEPTLHERRGPGALLPVEYVPNRPSPSPSDFRPTPVSRTRPVDIGWTLKVQGFAIPIDTQNGRFRMNLLLTTNANIPRQLFESHAFQESIAASNGSFELVLYRQRGDTMDQAGIVTIASSYARTTQINGIVSRFNLADGDVLYVPYHPGLIAVPCEAMNMRSGGTCGPIVSIIDNRSNDAATFLPQLTEITLP